MSRGAAPAASENESTPANAMATTAAASTRAVIGRTVTDMSSVSLRSTAGGGRGTVAVHCARLRERMDRWSLGLEQAVEPAGRAAEPPPVHRDLGNRDTGPAGG